LAATHAAIKAIDEDRQSQLLAATIMPDHVHVLLKLGTQLSLSQLIAKTKATVSRQHANLKWQLNFFDYRLRETDPAESFALYIFMNPYRAGLCDLNEAWPGWVSKEAIRWCFEGKLREGRFPQPVWLQEAERFARTLPSGAD